MPIITGLLDVVRADLHSSFPGQVEDAAGIIALAASKAERYVGEMRQIARTQGAAGARKELFDAMATVWEWVGGTELAAITPEQAQRERPLVEVLEQLSRVRA